MQLRAALFAGLLLSVGTGTAQRSADPQATIRPPSTTQIVMLGTGNPPADPDRSGPATAIVVNGTAYLIDMGAGIVRRAKSAAVDKGVAGLDPVKLRVVFVTHLHSDHVVGYPDLWLTPWILGRRVPLEVYGPTGLSAMTRHLIEAYRADFEERLTARKLYGGRLAIPEGHGINAHEISAGLVYQDANVTVTAFRTNHGIPSFGYRFDTADRSIVISGDTTPTQATIDACHGCDILIHEVLTQDWLAKRPDFVRYAADHHTTTTQLVNLATKAKPRLLILYHGSISHRPNVDSERSSPATLLREMAPYAGQVVVARDLDVY